MANNTGDIANTYQLIKYKPWHGQPSNAWGIVEDTDTTWIQVYHSCAHLSTTYEWGSKGRRLSQHQLPLQLRYTTMIHKSQRQTLDKAVIDIGNKELAAGCTFGAASCLCIVYVFLYQEEGEQEEDQGRKRGPR